MPSQPPIEPERFDTVHLVVWSITVMGLAAALHCTILAFALMTQMVCMPIIRWQIRSGREPSLWVLDALQVAQDVDAWCAELYNKADRVTIETIRCIHWLWQLFAGPTFLEIFRLLLVIAEELLRMPWRWLISKLTGESERKRRRRRYNRRGPQ